MTVAGNVAFSLRHRGVAKPEMRRVEKAAAILDIAHLPARPPRDLAGGQRQRVATGRTIMRYPRVFLCDEQPSYLDPDLRVHMRTEIERLREQVRTTTIYVTRDQMEAMTLADRIVVMQGGHIRQRRTPGEICGTPSRASPHGFLVPAMNLILGAISGGAAVLPDRTAIPLPADAHGT
jgi:ABC-type sugar transport system ATPase subunit